MKTTVHIPYYRVKRNGNGFWEPTVKMKLYGFQSVPCGRDGPAARAIAEEWNARWQAARRGNDEPEQISARRGSVDEQGFVYFLRVGSHVKIGFSTRPFGRAAQLRTGIAGKVDTILAVEGTRRMERRLHDRFAAYRRSGEWFVASAPILREMMRLIAFENPRASEQKVPKEGDKVGTFQVVGGHVPTPPPDAPPNL